MKSIVDKITIALTDLETYIEDLISEREEIQKEINRLKDEKDHLQELVDDLSYENRNLRNKPG